MSEADFYVRFWGVRGSVACPGNDYVRYGGNTSCVEIRCGERLLILDGGTGLKPLGQTLKNNGPVDADIFFSHTHLDHISGMPFFKPAYMKSSRLRLWAGHLAPEYSLEKVLSGLMQAPLFPIPIHVMAAEKSCHDFHGGETLEPAPGIVIRTAALNHPNGATGYRIEFAGKSICYITDTEHPESGHDQNVLDLIRDADLVIYDSTFTDEEYPRFKGWGHSTWQEGARLSDIAGVKKLVIFHHDPNHDDATMDRIATDAAATRAGTVVAQEGMVLRP